MEDVFSAKDRGRGWTGIGTCSKWCLCFISLKSHPTDASLFYPTEKAHSNCRRKKIFKFASEREHARSHNELIPNVPTFYVSILLKSSSLGPNHIVPSICFVFNNGHCRHVTHKWLSLILAPGSLPDLNTKIMKSRRNGWIPFNLACRNMGRFTGDHSLERTNDEDAASFFLSIFLWKMCENENSSGAGNGRGQVICNSKD